MSSRREALIGRFRAMAVDRLVRVREGLERARRAPTPEALTEALGELHTIKGESRMLGFSRLSRFTHALEQDLSGGTELTPAILDGAERAVRVIERALRGELDHPALEEWAGVLETKGLGSFAPALEPIAETEPRKASAPSEAGSRWTRVETSRVDRLCDLVGEIGWTFDRVRAGLDALSAEEDFRAALLELRDDLARMLPKMRDLEAAAWALRLVPVEPELLELARHGHDIAESSGKRVRFVLEASGAQLERPVLEGLSEPLLHLLRNAIDHGVEPPEERGDKPAEATVRLSAESSGASVTIAIEDDGRGLSVEGIRAAAVERGLLSADAAAALSDERVHALIFEPGFSTSRGISEISGRGVGLDVVRRRVDALGGTVRVDSVEGAGTRFELVVPATVTRERFIVVDVSGVLYGIPARRVSSIASAAETREDEVAGGRVVRSGEAWVKLRDLAADLGEEMQATPHDRLLFVDEGEERFAWRVPSVLGERELIRHALDPVLDEASFLAGSAMLDDGRLVLLLHVNEVIRRSGVTQRPRLVPGESRIAPRVLVADDSPIIRDLLAELLRDAGLEVETAVDGRDALERVDVRAPDLVVTDLEMPRVDGFGLVEGIRRRGLQIPIIVVSTRGSVEDRRRASEAGANAYVVKTGFEGSTLLETIAKFVEVRR